MNVTRMGVDLAKDVFQLHGVECTFINFESFKYLEILNTNTGFNFLVSA